MLCTESERKKIISEIQTISKKAAQEQYTERLNQIIIEIKERTGQDLSEKLKAKLRA
jgi:hypothetical protein